MRGENVGNKNDTIELWRSYNTSSKLPKENLKRTSNLVGEYAEFLIKEYTNGKLWPASKKGVDVKGKDKKLYQVKSRKMKQISSTQLGIIRSWEFDYLTIILFDESGGVLKALQCKEADVNPETDAKKYAKPNKHQNGWVITTTKKFLNDDRYTDITKEIEKINTGS